LVQNLFLVVENGKGVSLEEKVLKTLIACVCAEDW